MAPLIRKGNARLIDPMMVGGEIQAEWCESRTMNGKANRALPLLQAVGFWSGHHHCVSTSFAHDRLTMYHFTKASIPCSNDTWDSQWSSCRARLMSAQVARTSAA
jgi:hypothetical protein